MCQLAARQIGSFILQTSAQLLLGEKHAPSIASGPLSCVQVVVVLSGSMEPGFYRGDILFLNMGHQPIRAGEIVVFNIDQRDIPIVHRVIKVHERQPGGEVDVLTKV